MTRISIQIPANIVRAPRGAEPLANLALALARAARLLGVGLLKGLRLHHLPAAGGHHAVKLETPCADGIGRIKG